MGWYRYITLGLLIAASGAWADAGDSFYLNGAPVDGAAADAVRRNPNWRGEGGGFENPAVAMKAEEVVIILHPKKADVAATFDFENTAAARDVTMCFPISYKMLGLDPYENRESEEPLNLAGLSADFGVKVDGANTAYKLTEGGWGYPAFATWDVHFDAGATRRVVCRYVEPYAESGVSFDYRVYYALFTGATWKGPIGRGTVTVQAGGDFDWSRPLYYISAGMPPARDEGTKVVWEFKDLEPPFAAQAELEPDPYHYENVLRWSGICVGFVDLERSYATNAGYVRADGLNLRTAPDAAAANVAAQPTLAKEDELTVLERRGEWYRVKTEGGVEGWVRWRYVDPDTGRQNIYVELTLTEA